MPSQIDTSQPTHALPTTQSVRQNFAYAKNEIELLQGDTEDNAAAAAAAQASADLALTVQPIIFNLRRFTADFTLPAAYNGISAGPIEIAEGVTIDLEEGSTWRIA